MAPHPAFSGFESLPTFRPGELLHGASNNVLGRDGLCAWRHTASGVRIVLFNAPGPMTSANIVVGTLPESDAGHPHTLEHIVFLGSRLHPQRGYLDTLANRSLADGTNAYTEVDFTCYQADAAGFEGLSRVLPAFIDHVLRPNISKAAFLSEVYYTTSACKEAGVVFCEMHGREHTEDDIASRELFNILFADNPLSLSSGGICSHIRKLTADDIQRYHDNYYVGHNTSIIVGGSEIDHSKLLDSLRPILDDVASTDTRPYKPIPWELESKLTPLPPVTRKQVNFPCPDEDIGSVILAWRGPSASQLIDRGAIEIFLKYLVDTVSSPLRKKFVECDDPLSNYVNYDIETFLATSKIVIFFGGVSHAEDAEEDDDDDDNENEEDADEEPDMEEEDDEAEEEDEMKSMLTSGEFSGLVMEFLQGILDANKLPGGLEAVLLTIKRERESFLASLEEDSHEVVPNMLIEEVLYAGAFDASIGTDARGVLDRLAALEGKDEAFWLDLLRRQFIEAPRVEMFMTPDCTLAEKLADVDEALAKERIEKHGKEQLVAIGKKNEEQIEKLEKTVFPADAFPEPPSAVNITRCPYSVRREKKDNYWAQSLAIETDFVHTTLFFSTEKLALRHRLVLPLVTSLLLNSDVYLEDGTVIPFMQNSYAIDEVTVATDMTSTSCGYSNGLAVHCVKTHFASTPENCKKAYELICRTIFKEVVTGERLTTIVKNMQSDITEDLRDPVSMLHAVAGLLPYVGVDNDMPTDICAVPNFVLGNLLSTRVLLTSMVGDGDGKGGEDGEAAISKVCALVNETLDALRALPSGDVFVQVGSREPAQWHEEFSKIWATYRAKALVPAALANVTSDNNTLPIRRLLPRYDLGGDEDVARVVGVPGAENSYLDVRVSADVYPGHADWGPLMVLGELLCRMEGPLSDAIRKAGLAYGYGLANSRWKGYIRASINETAAPQVAWVAMCDKLAEVREKLQSGDNSELAVDLDTAKSVSIYALNCERATPEHVCKGVLGDAALESESSPIADRKLEESIEAVQLKDLLRVFDTHVAQLLTKGGRRITLTCGPSAVTDAVAAFKTCKYAVPFMECRAEEVVPQTITAAVDRMVKK